jgi:hypothetical protein
MKSHGSDEGVLGSRELKEDLMVYTATSRRVRRKRKKKVVRDGGVYDQRGLIRSRFIDYERRTNMYEAWFRSQHMACLNATYRPEIYQTLFS